MQTVTASLSQFVRVQGAQIGKLQGVFTHVRGKVRRLFTVVLLAEGVFEHCGVLENADNPSATADPILFAPTFRMTEERVIVGLPSIDTQPIWVTPAVKPNTFWFIDQDIYTL
jgi:hypothetical protein